MMFSNINLYSVSVTYVGKEGIHAQSWQCHRITHLPEKVLLLFQQLERFGENRADGTSPHLQPYVLAISPVS